MIRRSSAAHASSTSRFLATRARVAEVVDLASDRRQRLAALVPIVRLMVEAERR